MTEELLLLIAQIMLWVGVIASAPFICRATFELARYLRVKLSTSSQISLIDEKGNELSLTLKRKNKKQELIEALKKSQRNLS